MNRQDKKTSVIGKVDALAQEIDDAILVAKATQEVGAAAILAKARQGLLALQIIISIPEKNTPIRTDWERDGFNKALNEVLDIADNIIPNNGKK